MLELYQAEWCPYSHRVRERLTELEVDFVARQVEPEPEDRERLRQVSGQDSIPTLLTEDGDALSGVDEILPWLDESFDEPPGASRHRAQARAHAG